MGVSLRRRHLLAVVASAALLGACGDDDGAGSLRIDGIDIDYDRDVYETAPGEATLEFRNRGSLAHNIVFREGVDAPVASGVDDFVPAGQNVDYDVVLVAGDYEFYCSVPGHEAAGMVGTLVVG